MRLLIVFSLSLLIAGCSSGGGSTISPQGGGGNFTGEWKATGASYSWASQRDGSISCTDYTHKVEHVGNSLTTHETEVNCTGGLSMTHTKKTFTISGNSLLLGNEIVGTITTNEIHFTIAASGYTYKIDVTPEGNGFRYAETLADRGNSVFTAHLER